VGPDGGPRQDDADVYGWADGVLVCFEIASTP